METELKTKECSDCNTIKNISEFYYVKKYDRPHTYCKECVKARNKKHRSQKKNKKLEEEMLLEKGKKEAKMKICKLCNEEKPDLIKHFRPDRRECTDCERLLGREYRRGDIGKGKAKKWAEDNPERLKEIFAKAYQRNKPKIREKFRERYHTETVFKLKSVAKSRIHTALKKYKKYGISKSKRTIEYIGCDIEFLVEWYSYCFVDDFTFENHGDVWHIDHVMPLNTFDLVSEEEQELGFNWRNTMPLIKEDNMEKKDKIYPEQINIHYENLINFHSITGIEFPDKYKKLYAKHLTMIRESP